MSRTFGSLVIVGTGAHARETRDVAESAGDGSDRLVMGFIEPSGSTSIEEVDGLPILGGLDWFEERAPESVQVICAVGSPHIMRDLVVPLARMGMSFASAVSPHAHISGRAQINYGSIIFPGATVNTGASIGSHVTLNVGSSVSHDSRVGDFCNLNPGARLAGNVTAGPGCYIGMGASVIQGISLGEWCTVGAGAVVISDVPAGATVVGVPARVIRSTDPSEPVQTLLH